MRAAIAKCNDARNPCTRFFGQGVSKGGHDFGPRIADTILNLHAPQFSIRPPRNRIFQRVDGLSHLRRALAQFLTCALIFQKDHNVA